MTPTILTGKNYVSYTGNAFSNTFLAKFETI